MLSGMCVEVCLPVVLSPTSNNTMKMNKNMNMMASRHHGQQQFLGKKRPRASASVTTSTSTSTTTDNNTKTINMQRSRRTRRVHFSSSSTELLSSSSSSPMPPITLIYIGRSGTYQDLINDVWYNKNELAVFTNEAREYVLEGLRLRGNNSNSNNGGGDEQQQRAKNSTSTTITSCECSRGYERYDLSRVQQKALTRKVILLACSQKVAINLSADEMAMIARKSSSYAVQEAFVTGFQDYCDVYHDLQQEANTNTNTTSKSIVVQSKQQQQNIAAEDDEDDASTIISTSSTIKSDTTSSTTATATTTISVNYDDVTPPVTPPSCKRLRRTF